MIFIHALTNSFTITIYYFFLMIKLFKLLFNILTIITITKLYLILHFLLIHLIMKPIYTFLMTLFYQITLLLFHTSFLYFTIYLLDLTSLILPLLRLTYFLITILVIKYRNQIFGLVQHISPCHSLDFITTTNSVPRKK